MISLVPSAIGEHADLSRYHTILGCMGEHALCLTLKEMVQIIPWEQHRTKNNGSSWGSVYCTLPTSSAVAGSLMSVTFPDRWSDTSAHISCAPSRTLPNALQPLTMPRAASCMSMSSTVGGTSSRTSRTTHLHCTQPLMHGRPRGEGV